ncbi:hypothetical protein DOTSEDRAFT_19054 [Dothistroma septosporum NZE10]|uniref:Uncharacterized protein n=1 Tax=Dothistroma septosporum (strain NZE10 / CBS 128990) TaxID=675120 RepID=N1Q1K3_DOTSN|nr:hypothetical protein DOTSEDRAFT_19054 [Dothistroma septosporum NZE10]
MPRPKPTSHRSIAALHLHSNYQAEDSTQQFYHPGFDTNRLATMLRTPSSEPGFKHDSFLKEEDSDRDDSEEPKQNTQVPAQKQRHPHQIPGTFENVCKIERGTLTRHLKAFVHTSSKANDITPDQRNPMLWGLRERKLKELEDMGKLTIRTHPDRVAKGWTILDDELWVRKQFSAYINGSTVGTSFFAPTAKASRSERPVQRRDHNEGSDDHEDDQDDEELDLPGIKRGLLENGEMAVPRAGAAAARANIDVPAHLKLLDGKAVTRSFCFRSMLNETNGIAAIDGIQGVQRTWKWIEGRMVVWPAFENEVDSKEEKADSVFGDGEGDSGTKQPTEERVEIPTFLQGIDRATEKDMHGIKRPAEEVVVGEVAKKMKIEE